MNLFKRINKDERIKEWIDWCEIPIIIEQPNWFDDRKWKAYYDIDEQLIKINGNQSKKEIIKSIIHEICHYINNDRANDPDIWDREDRCIKCEKQWKLHPDEIAWDV